MYWNYFCWTSVWHGDETVFRFGFDPFLPAVVAYSSAALALLMLLLAGVALFGLRTHSMRTPISFALAALTVASSSAFAAVSPWRLQQFIDGTLPMTP
jgi:hypothetical protein